MTLEILRLKSEKKDNGLAKPKAGRDIKRSDSERDALWNGDLKHGEHHGLEV